MENGAVVDSPRALVIWLVNNTDIERMVDGTIIVVFDADMRVVACASSTVFPPTVEEVAAALAVEPRPTGFFFASVRCDEAKQVGRMFGEVRLASLISTLNSLPDCDFYFDAVVFDTAEDVAQTWQARTVTSLSLVRKERRHEM